jgi:chemosensory pili system protein ChpC
MSDDKTPAAREIRGVLLPVGGSYLLLPNAAVAELIGYLEPDVAAGDADCCLGWVAWRGRKIPVASIERAMGDQEASGFTRRARIAVLNTLNGNRDLPYMGVLTHGISRLSLVTPNNLEDDEEGRPDAAVIRGAVKINGQMAWIPDLDELERLMSANAAPSSD